MKRSFVITVLSCAGKRLEPGNILLDPAAAARFLPLLLANSSFLMLRFTLSEGY